MGEEEVAGMAFPEGVEVAGFEVDAGAFHLQVQEDIGPEIITHFGVLVKEHPCGGVIAVGSKACEVTHVGAHLHAESAAKEGEVAIE